MQRGYACRNLLFPKSALIGQMVNSLKGLLQSIMFMIHGFRTSKYTVAVYSNDSLYCINDM